MVCLASFDRRNRSRSLQITHRSFQKSRRTVSPSAALQASGEHRRPATFPPAVTPPAYARGALAAPKTPRHCHAAFCCVRTSLRKARQRNAGPADPSFHCALSRSGPKPCSIREETLRPVTRRAWPTAGTSRARAPLYPLATLAPSGVPPTASPRTPSGPRVHHRPLPGALPPIARKSGVILAGPSPLLPPRPCRAACSPPRTVLRSGARLRKHCTA